MKSISRLTGRSLIAASLLFAGTLGSLNLARADEKAASENNSASPDPKTSATPKNVGKVAAKKAAAVAAAAALISPEREAAAVEFAQQNHPELASLLQGLKQNGSKEYQAALVDLDRAVERISKLKEKTPERYEIQLAEWKITSRIRLLAARLSMSDDPAVETELKAALRERLEMRLTAQRTERDRLQQRVTKLDQAISEMSSKADSLIEKQFAELRTPPASAKASAKNKAKRPVEAGTAGATDAKGEK